jgi:hypothetical protein
MLVQCVNDNYLVSKEHGEEHECKRYTAERNCKYLSVFISFFERYWLPEAHRQGKEYYSFFVTHSSIVQTGKYRKVLRQLLEFVDAERHEEFSEQEGVKSQPLEEGMGEDYSSELAEPNEQQANAHASTPK